MRFSLPCFLILFLSGPMLLACTTTGSTDSNEPLGPLVVAAPSDGSDDALVTGEVAWSGKTGECVYSKINNAPGDSAHGIVWPHGTSWDSESEEIVLPNLSRLSIGEPFELRGGEFSVDTPTSEGWGLTADVLTHARACGWKTFLYIQTQ